jgi:predicted DnaQ family exonuclease/DinG family helicase
MPFNEFVALDVESTGLDPSRNEVIEVATRSFTAGEIGKVYTTFVKPRMAIPLEIVRLTGISDREVNSAPPLLDVETAIRNAVGRATIVGHNIGFDIEMLAAGGINLTNDAIDTLTLAKLLIPGLPSYSLTNLALALGIEPDGAAHRAAADASMTARVMQELIKRISKIDQTSRMRIASLLDASEDPVASLFLEIPPDPAGAGETVNLSPEFRFLTTLKRPETLKRTGDTTKIPADSVRRFFSKDGVLANAIDEFQHRDGQEKMAVAVTHALNDDEILMVEAGTGTGKSMAYLVPSALHAMKWGERVVVSTNTIALQDQLFQKDIPALREALASAGIDEPLKAAVVKGRGNYVCLRRWFNQQRVAATSRAESSMRGRAMIWLRETETGDRAELNMNSEEEQAFRWISAEGEACAAARCQFQQRNQCFLYRARREAEASHVLVVNHALLLSDALSENSVLPDTDRLIIDEAHHLEEQATKQFGFSVSDISVAAAIDEAIRQDGPVMGGAISHAADFLSRSLKSAGERRATLSDALISHIKTSLEANSQSKQAAVELFHRLSLQLNRGNGTDRSLRLTEANRTQGDWSEIEILTDNLLGRLRALDKEVRWFLDQVEHLELNEEPGMTEDDRSDITLQLMTTQRELLETRLNAQEIVLEPDTGGIYWIERNYAQRVSLHAAPLHIGAMLQDRLLNKQRSTILTSATITTDSGFSFIRERLGIEKTRELSLPAPFDYRSSTMLFVANDMPEPNQPNYQRAIEDAVVDLGIGARGRTLVLFTSHSALQQTYAGIKPRLEREGIAVLAQGTDGSPRRLMERMKLGGAVVVLGAATFWEGIDIAGPALSALAIAKLPFAVPTDPIVAARSELFDNPFNDFSVPQAILRFKQGFGRLIRRHEDIGVCAVLDRRVLSKRYGKAFLESLPDCTLTVDSTRVLGDTAARWLGSSDQQRDSALL